MKNIAPKKPLFWAALVLAVLSGCWPGDQKKTGLVVINVLDQELYDDCHISGSINIPFDMIEQKAATIDKDADLVIYCSNYQCSTSEYAARKFLELGFKNVCVYEGGTAEWYQCGLPVDGPQRQPYLRKVCARPPCDSTNSIYNVTMHELAEKMAVTSNQKRAA